jgi:hypothetical protein
LGCHRSRIADRIVFDKLVQVLRFGCSYQSIAGSACSATTIRDRRDEWIRLGIFAGLKQIALQLDRNPAGYCGDGVRRVEVDQSAHPWRIEEFQALRRVQRGAGVNHRRGLSGPGIRTE